MKTFWRSLAFAGILTAGGLGLGVSPARAQGFTFGYSGPGLSLGVASGGGYYGGYPVVTPAPVVVTPPPVVVPPPYVVARPYYPGYYGGYPGGYRPYHHHYRR
jgi:hypothetical protein